VICHQAAFVTLQLKAIESDGENAGPIEETLLKEIDTAIQVTKNFHVFNSRDGFIHIKVNMLVKSSLSVKDESQILPCVVGTKKISS